MLLLYLHQFRMKMKNKQYKKIPTAILHSGEKLSWLEDVRRLTIGELIEIYFYSDAIVETIREPLIILDKNLRVKTANKAFFDTFKTTKKDTYGKYVYKLNSGEWNIPMLRKLLEDILPKNHSFNDFEVSHNFQKIGQKTILLNARRIVLEKNKTELILLAIEDITKQQDAQLKKDEFVNIVSHELKTPLTSMKVFVEIVQKRLADMGDKKDIYLISKVNNQVDRLTNLINDLLSLGRIGEGKLNLLKKKVDLDALIKRIVIDYQYTTEKHTIVREGEISVKVLCDEHSIEQVLTNLITNAIKYSLRSDKIIVKVTRTKNEAIVSVQDFGEGIAKKDFPRVFERYFRADNKKEDIIEGFGLGLYITSEIIKRHNGRIWGESKPGKGSTFYFALPI